MMRWTQCMIAISIATLVGMATIPSHQDASQTIGLEVIVAGMLFVFWRLIKFMIEDEG